MHEIRGKNKEDRRIEKSPLGTASLVISLISSAIFASVTLITMIGAKTIQYEGNRYDLLIYLAKAIVLADFSISITGFLLGITALFLIKKTKVFTIFAILINLWMIICLLIFYYMLTTQDFFDHYRA